MKLVSAPVLKRAKSLFQVKEYFRLLVLNTKHLPETNLATVFYGYFLWNLLS